MREIRRLLVGGDRRSIADSHRARVLIDNNPSLVIELAALTTDEDWLVAQRALDLLEKLAHVEEILLENVSFPQTFMRAWALDSLATLAERRPALMPIMRRHLRDFERSPGKALQARARQIRARLGRPGAPRRSGSSEA